MTNVMVSGEKVDAKIREAIRLNGINVTVASLARAGGLNPATIYGIRAGRSPGSNHALEGLIKGFREFGIHCTPNDLMVTI
jgi:hypothetical protein